MVTMAIPRQTQVQESTQCRSWTFQDGLEISRFLAQSVGLMCAAIFLYSLGPTLGLAMLGGWLGVWALLRYREVSVEHKDDANGESQDAPEADSRSHCTNPVWLKSAHLFSLATAHPVVRQGA
jgi:hypothetical protein